MAVPVSQMFTVATYVLGRRLRGRKRYPLVLMLEPLFRCNLACAGCGKIQHPAEILRKNLTPEQCFQAVDECGAPMVSIPGGEPLMHPQIVEIVEGLVARKKYVYLCTNALKLEDHAVCREGTYDVAVSAIKAALAAGFRVTTNTTLFDTADPERIRGFFDEMMRLGVEGMMVSPGYPYDKAPDQEHFLKRNQTVGLFRKLFDKPGRWVFNQSPLFMEFLKGNWQLECTPWGNPTYNLFGWQKPCYLMNEGYAQSFQELLDTTDWDAYGCASGNPKCTDCMVHSGYEPSAVAATFGTWRGFWATARITLFGPLKEQPLKVVATRVAAEPQPTAVRRTSEGRLELPVLK